MKEPFYKEYAQPEQVPTRQVMSHPSKPDVYLPVHRRPIRLPDVDYTATDCLCFVTMNIEKACTVRFVGETGRVAWEALTDELKRIGCTIHAMCLMPDHAHLLLAPSGGGESISDIVRRLKTRVCFVLRQDHRVYLKWQPSFYDHVLRSTEAYGDELEAIVGYIHANPVNAGLAEDYPFRM